MVCHRKACCGRELCCYELHAQNTKIKSQDVRAIKTHLQIEMLSVHTSVFKIFEQLYQTVGSRSTQTI